MRSQQSRGAQNNKEEDAQHTYNSKAKKEERFLF